MEKMLDLNNLADGAVAERIDLELRKVLENIADPNTDAKKTRKLTISLTLKADEKRDIISIGIQAKPTLAPAKDIETKIVLDRDAKGKVVGAELKSGVKGQTFINDEGEIADDQGKVINLRQSKEG